jgi:hypothetical protein
MNVKFSVYPTPKPKGCEEGNIIERRLSISIINISILCKIYKVFFC